MNIHQFTSGLLAAALWLTAQGQTADDLAKGGTAAVKACALKLIDVTEEEAAVIMAVVSHRSGVPLNRLQFNSIKCVSEDGKDRS